MKTKTFMCPYCGDHMAIVYGRPFKSALTELRLKCVNSDCETILTISHLHGFPDRCISDLQTTYKFATKV